MIKHSWLQKMICILLCFSLAIPVVYMAVSANHACPEQKCIVCHVLQICVVLLQSLSYIGIAGGLIRIGVPAVSGFMPHTLPRKIAFSLVHLKVKLSS